MLQKVLLTYVMLGIYHSSSKLIEGDKDWYSSSKLGKYIGVLMPGYAISITESLRNIMGSLRVDNIKCSSLVVRLLGGAIGWGNWGVPPLLFSKRHLDMFIINHETIFWN